MKKKDGKTIAGVGEYGLIERIKTILPACGREDLMVSIGDDTAVIRIDHERVLLATCDIQIEDSHFSRRTITAYQLGRRSAAVNLSDIAAMGGTPTFAFVSLGLPSSYPLDDFDDLMRGIGDELLQYSAVVAGGNLARTADKMVVDITVLGQAALARVLTRSGARPGDRIYVSGVLGAAAGGLRALEKVGPDYPGEFDDLVRAHLQPTPRIPLGRLIADSGVATAMTDISDGLSRDLLNICQRSNVGAEINGARLPLPNKAAELEELTGCPALELALNGGEDYELLFTVRPQRSQEEIEILAAQTATPITEIGRIVPREKGCFLIDGKERRELQAGGWNHFGE